MLITILLGVAAAVAAAAAAAGVGRMFDARGRAWWVAPAAALGYVAGHVAVAGLVLRPVEVTDRLPWLALAAGLWGFAASLWQVGPRATVAGRAGLVVLALGLVLGPVVGRDDLTPATTGWAVAVAGVTGAAWLNLGVLARRNGCADACLGLLAASAGASPALLLSGSAMLGFLAAALTAALGVTCLASRGRTGVRGWEVGAAVLSGLLVEGYVYAALPATTGALLGLAPAAAWVTRSGPLRRRWPRGASAAGAVAVLLVVGGAVGLAVAASPPSDF